MSARPRRYRCSWTTRLPHSADRRPCSRCGSPLPWSRTTRQWLSAPKSALVRDEAEVSRAIQRLSDAAALRAPEIAAAVGGTPDPLAGALAVIAAQEGFNLRLPKMTITTRS